MLLDSKYCKNVRHVFDIAKLLWERSDVYEAISHNRIFKMFLLLSLKTFRKITNYKLQLPMNGGKERKNLVSSI